MDEEARPSEPLIRVPIHDNHAEMEDDEPRKKSAATRQVLATLLSCLAPLMIGFALGYSSPTIPLLEDEGKLTIDQSAWYGSIVTMGAAAGAPLAAVGVGKLGRKLTIMLSCLPFSVGWLLITSADSYIQLYAGRALSGIGVGMASVATPLYIAEIATSDMRGTLGACFQLAVTVGVLIAFSGGSVLEWRWLSNIGAIFSALLVVLMLHLPETPTWLTEKHPDKTKAFESLRWLRSGTDADVARECHEIHQCHANRAEGGVSLRELCTTRCLYRPVLISVGLMVFQQTSGVNAVMFYTKSIFKTAGFANSGNLPSIIVAVVQVVATFVASLLLGKIGRRILLVFAGLLMAVSLGTLGLYYYLTEHGNATNLGWLSLTSMAVYIAAFSIGWGPVPWILMSEILPVRVKGLGSGLSVVVNWCIAFVVTKEFSEMEHFLNTYGAFWLFGSACLVGVLFVLFIVPETKGRSLQQIEMSF